MTASADSLSDDDAETNRATETETDGDSETKAAPEPDTETKTESETETDTDAASKNDNASNGTDAGTATEPDGGEDGSRPASSQQSGDPGEPEGPAHRDTGNEPVDPQTRKRMLAEYDHRCQTCGRTDPSHGGLASLEVHHIERDPDGMDEDDPENLTVLCHSCHTWFHNRSTIEDSPVSLTAADRMHLLPQDIEILQYLYDEGPARTGPIADGISVDQSATSIRDRLWRLMELDNLVEDRDRQIVDKDVETGEWGLTEQIEHSSRGHLPNGPQLLYQRIEDELVRRALERGCAREDVAEVLGMSRRTTFTKERRARAIDFPLDAIDRGGRPPKSQPDDGGSRSERTDTATASVSSDGEETEAAASDTAGSAAGRLDGAETTNDLDEDALDEIWTEHHSALDPEHRDPEIAAMAATVDPDELQDELPDGISPVQLLNALVIASQT